MKTPNRLRQFVFLLCAWLLALPVFAQTNTPPTAAISYPFNGATYMAPASIPIYMVASDVEGPVSKVELYIGATLAGTFPSGGTITWNNVAAGSYTLTTKVYDSGGLITTSNAVTVTVLAPDPANTPPTAAIGYPTANAIYMAPASFSINPVVADTNGTINRVEYYFGTSLAAAQNAPPYGLSVTNMVAGTYSLTVKVWDNQGASTTSAAVSITVMPTDATDVAPTVSIAAPTANSVYPVGQAFPLSAVAGDTDGTINRIEFVVSGVTGNTYVGTLTTAPFNAAMTINVAGAYTLTARAYDNKGARTISAGVPITITTPPTVSITAPANNAAYTAPAAVTITASAVDADGSVARVDFYNGATLLGTSTTAPYTFAWSNVAAGNYSLTAKAYDNVGISTTSAAVAITVAAAPVNLAPSVSLTAPANNTVVSAPGSATLTASAADTDGTISKVEFYNGATLLGTVTAAPYNYTWSNIPAGTYTVTAKAYDNLNAATTSAAVTLISNALPTVSLTAPANKATFTSPASISLAASASDSDGTISKVEFYNGATLLGTATTAPYTFAWNAVSNGTYTLTAKAYDNRNAVKTSTAVTVTVGTNQVPTVSITAPATNTVATAPATFTITSTAADADGSISKVEFYNGATLLATITAAPYTYTWSAVGAGTYTVTAKAYDNLNAVTTSAPVTLISNTLPTVAITAPATNTTLAAPATFALSATAADSDGTLSKVEFYNGATLIGTVTAAPYNFSWSSVAAGSYTVTAKAYDNAGGTTTSAPVTLIANTLPTVSMTAPANNTTVAPLTNVTLSASAADSDGTISKVEFYNGATLLGTVTAAPYNYTWVSVPSGTYSITAKAYDNRSAVTTSTAITLKVNTLPTVSITAPASNTVLTAPASFALSASAADSDGTISKVEFYNGATLIGTVTTAPYNFAWNGVVAGSYTITAKAYDNFGGTTSSAAVTLIANTLPTVSMTSPANNTVATAPASFTLTATAADADGSISKVEFYNGATLLGTVTTAPYSFAWSAVAAGTYAVTAKAYDNRGAVSTSSAVTLIANNAPTVSITAPANNTVVTAPAAFTLTATASDTDGSLSKVEFYNGATLLGTVTAAPYTYTWSGVAAGTYTVTAKAYDNNGATTTSAGVTLISNALPVVSITAPANNAVFDAPAAISLTASATDSDGTISKVEFYNGATLLGTVTAAPYTYVWSSVAAGTYAVTAKAYDNRSAITTSSTTTVIVNAKPTVSMTAPANNTVVTAPASFSLTAAAADTDGTISKVEFYNGATLLGTVTAAPYTYAWNAVAAGTYTVMAKAYDNQGSVTTSAPVTLIANALPTVSITAPANGATFIAPANVSLTASAADSDGTISKVEFYNGAALLGTVTVAPYTFAWNAVAAGSYTLSAKAYDNRGAIVTSSAVAITVSGNLPPVVGLTAPANNTVLPAPGNVTLTATASDPDGTVSKVEFYQGGTLIATATTSPYGAQVSGLASGSYAFTAKAYDNQGVSTTSSVVNVIVNRPPVVAITTPANYATFASAAAVPLTATASDPDGTISKVEFYRGGALIGTATVAPYSLSVSGLPDGPYVFAARAYDNQGATTDSAPINVTVGATAAAPVTFTYDEMGRLIGVQR